MRYDYAMLLRSLQCFPTTYRLKFKFWKRAKSLFSLIPYSSSPPPPCILPHISYSGQAAQNTMKPLYSFVPLLTLFPWLGICFPSLYVCAQIRSIYFLFALLALFTYSMCREANLYGLSVGYLVFRLALAHWGTEELSQDILFPEFPSYG